MYNILRRAPAIVTVHPAALFSILDHFLRRDDSQERVIGTLLGTRTEREVEIRSAFPVLHHESDDQIALDMEYHTQMLDMHHKVAPKEVVVGWYVLQYHPHKTLLLNDAFIRYSTGSKLDMYTALIHNYYTNQVAPHQAIHLSMTTGVQGDVPGVKTYVGCAPAST